MADDPAHEAPPKARKFPCPQCGAKLDFNPEARGLVCPYCGHEAKIPEPVDGKVEELDFELYLARLAERHKTPVEAIASQVRCGGCGAEVLFKNELVTQSCPFCGTHLDNMPTPATELIVPESIIPFQIPLRGARDAFTNWVHGLWFAPSELKKLANLGQLGGVYVPYWTYDSMTYSPYTGMRGDDYYTSESYTTTDADGKSKTETRQVKHTSWSYASGEIQHFFDDVLICGSQSMPEKLLEKIEPWELPELTAFESSYLAGFVTERYSIDLKEGFDFARAIMDVKIRELVRRDIGGDHQQIDSLQTNHTAITFKHALFPIWLAHYHYRDKNFQVLINGQTGKVAGDRPWSVMKIVRLVLAILLAIGAIILVVNLARGGAARAGRVGDVRPPSAGVAADSGRRELFRERRNYAETSLVLMNEHKEYGFAN